MYINVKIKHKNLQCRNSDINVVHFTFTTVFILLLIKNQPRNLITRRERKRKVKVGTEKDRSYGYYHGEQEQGRGPGAGEVSGSGAGLLSPHTLDTHCSCCAAVA